jgi:hypothetical protein
MTTTNKAPVSSYNEWKQIIQWMMAEDSVVETIGLELLQWLEHEDPKGFVLPSDKRMRKKPTYTQIGKLDTAGYDALTAVGIDSASAGAKRQVRPGERNVGTWQRNWRKHIIALLASHGYVLQATVINNLWFHHKDFPVRL